MRLLILLKYSLVELFYSFTKFWFGFLIPPLCPFFSQSSPCPDLLTRPSFGLRFHFSNKTKKRQVRGFYIVLKIKRDNAI